MARKKHKKTHYRRRSVGAVGTGMVTEVAGLGAGALLGMQVPKFLTSIDSRIVNAGVILLGYLAPKIAGRSPFAKSLGSGMIAMGTAKLIGGFVPSLGAADDVVLLSGIDEIGALDQIGADISELNGTDIAEVNGYDEF